MLDTTLSTEKSNSLLSKFSFLKLKKVWIPIITLTSGIGIFFGLNAYEVYNHCILQYSNELPFLSCQEITIPYVIPIDECPDFALCYGGGTPGATYKPLILLYPPQNTLVGITLEYTPGFSATYPEYDTTKRGWSVLAHSDGTLFNQGTNQDTYGLFWEGNPQPNNYDLSHGFIIKGSELRNFLFIKLTEIGLNTKEKSDFIMFWYPKLQEYPYIQITFAGQDYTDIAKLSISPTPDSLLRVFMVAKPLAEYREIPEQKLQKFERKGFSVVEWGGTIVR